jgi:hypothetical protein
VGVHEEDRGGRGGWGLGGTGFGFGFGFVRIRRSWPCPGATPRGAPGLRRRGQYGLANGRSGCAQPLALVVETLKRHLPHQHSVDAKFPPPPNPQEESMGPSDLNRPLNRKN